MISLYIATGFEHRHRVHEFMAKLGAAAPGRFKTAYDWTKHTFNDSPTRVFDREIDALLSCSQFVALLPGGSGTMTEIGIAWAAMMSGWIGARWQTPLIVGAVKNAHGWYAAPVMHYCSHVDDEDAAVAELVRRHLGP